ncbi:hypothetical protein C8F04DRAFT_1113101 [Mycena alexandri]|uniref:Calcium uniporter protein, mitochondrial n=1 Tax=Mycena alexandri TaxID=1745969 RepID=A0AAD6SQD2_9AGAR|nr:hypothetical protein C8F04DRAFT_1113101 [Mycena alexandri]
MTAHDTRLSSFTIMFSAFRAHSAFLGHGHRPTGQGLNSPNSLSRAVEISSFFRNTAHFRYSTRSEAANNTDVSHSEFLAGADSSSSWKESRGNSLDGGTGATVDELDNLTAGKGKLSPTASHLFKLILPLGMLKFDQDKQTVSKGKAQKRTHPHRLILGSLAPAAPKISFRSVSASGQQFQWSDSTDVGDFIRDAARSAKFSICIGYDPVASTKTADASEIMFDVEVPTVADRTRFLRRRLEYIGGQLKGMEDLKKECDHEARRGARRMATGGFGILAIYWATVARLTFWDYGVKSISLACRDVMEPITYLSGLSTVMAGYLWFLYQGRDVSYSSVLDRSISARRETLYKNRGFDIERWMDLVTEAKGLRSEIRRISEDYEPRDGSSEEEEKEERKEEEREEEVSDRNEEDSKRLACH